MKLIWVSWSSDHTEWSTAGPDCHWLARSTSLWWAWCGDGWSRPLDRTPPENIPTIHCWEEAEKHAEISSWGGFVVFSLKHKAKPMLGQIRGLMTRSPLAPILVTHIVFASVRSETFQPKLSRMISYTNPLFLHCNWQCCMSTVASYYFQNDAEFTRWTTQHLNIYRYAERPHGKVQLCWSRILKGCFCLISKTDFGACIDSLAQCIWLVLRFSNISQIIEGVNALIYVFVSKRNCTWDYSTCLTLYVLNFNVLQDYVLGMTVTLKWRVGFLAHSLTDIWKGFLGEFCL